MKTFPVTLYPILFCLILFGIDKLFFLPIITENTYSWKKIERKFYDLKEDLFLVMKDEFTKHPEEGIGLILGSSRSGEFDSKMVSKFVSNTKTFNFGAPMGPPSFYSYWLERVLSESIPLRYVLIEADPLLFSKQSIEYSLNGSYDPGFILRNYDWNREKKANPWEVDGQGFSSDEVETYFLKKLFALYKYPIDPGAIKANNREIEVGFIPGMSTGITGKEHKKGYEEKIKLANRITYGALPNEIKFANADFFLERDAENMYVTYLKNQSLSVTQIYFFKRMIHRLTGTGIPTIIYFPAVAPALHKKMKEDGVLQEFNQRVKTIVEIANQTPNTKIRIVDPNEDPNWNCRDFVDSLHLSGACFPNLLPIVYPKDMFP
ncbi:MAG: DUF1574 domain-containing protein [Leptospira sp.]|jgi:hypothetical protein|nr:DUF1574 domain-containing protein [Leptospira sp.]